MALNFSHLFENIILLSTVLTALVGWVVSFGGACAIGTVIAQAFPETWWIVIFELILNLGIVFVIVSATLPMYRLVILTFLAVSISYLTASIGAFIRSGNSAAQALGAGLLIMILVQFVWVFIFGSHDESYIASSVNHGNTTAPAFVTSNRVEKEEVVDNKSAGHSVPMGSVGYPEMNGQNGGVYQANHPSQSLPPAAAAGSASPGGVGGASPLQYNEQVSALHAYQANPDDPTELSFAKGEVLDVVERKGNWWQARKQDGTIGIVPSNYFAN